MILATHLIFTADGFWLPNDPRGSWSEFVASWELLLAGGKATKVNTRASVAARPHDHAARMRAKQALQFPPVSFTGIQAREIGQGFSAAAAKSGYVVYACAILPEHVHMVVRRHDRDSKRIMGHLKHDASMALYRAKLHPFDGLLRPGGQAVSCWAEKGWSVYLDTPEAVHTAIAYVVRNPEKEGKPLQNWSFVKPYSPFW